MSPKIMMILVTVIPMTFFGILDYEKPKDGIPQDQEDGVIIFFKCVLSSCHYIYILVLHRSTPYIRLYIYASQAESPNLG